MAAGTVLALFLLLLGRPDAACAQLGTDVSRAVRKTGILVLVLSGGAALSWTAGYWLRAAQPGLGAAGYVFSLTLLLCPACVLVMALTLYALAPLYRGLRDAQWAWVVAAGSACPLLATGLLAAQPVLLACSIAVLPYAGFLVSLMARRLLGIPAADGAEFAAVVMVAGIAATMGLGAVLGAAGLV